MLINSEYYYNYIFICSLQTSILYSLTIFFLMTGVLAQHLVTETEVHVKVYLPPNFLRYKPEVFVPKNKFVNVTSNLKQHNLQVDKFGMVAIKSSCLNTAQTYSGDDSGNFGKKRLTKNSNICIFCRSG